MNAPSRLRVEHLTDPLGIWNTTPRLSWTLPSGSISQIGYKLELDDVPLGRVGWRWSSPCRPGATADIVLPDGSRHQATPRAATFRAHDTTASFGRPTDQGFQSHDPAK
jgi:hypothetical protein